MFRARDFSVRSLSLRVFGLVVFLTLFAALLQTQVLEGAYFNELSNGNRVREVRLPAPRGIIYDRNGIPLVSNVPAYRLIRCGRNGQECSVDSISRDQAIDFQAEHGGGNEAREDLVVDSVRNYLFGGELAHVLGYVSEISKDELAATPAYALGDRVGRGGVEEEYESLLKGVAGKELIEVDAQGKRLKILSAIQPVAGQKLKLTIDAKLQKVAFEALIGTKGAIVVTNPQTGEVLALASGPTFDPNIFTDMSVDSEERLRTLNALFSDESQPLFDRAISGTYPPGSTFKIVTATAGLESGKIDQEYTVEDTGEIVIGPYKFANWKFLDNGGTQGVLNVVGALKVSNDIFFYRLGEKIGLDGLVEWMKKFGLAKKTGIDLPMEANGVIPTKKWREKNAPEWYLGDTFHLAIGQGKILVTPLQMNSWTNVIANGGSICRPHLFGKTDCQKVGISQKTIDLVRDGLVSACAPGGTAYPLFGFVPQVACKTGTAEVGDTESSTHGWLTAFAPAKNPKISVTVLVEKGGEGSEVAAPIVKKILEKYFELRR